MPPAAKPKFFSRPILPVILWFGAAVIIPIVQFLRPSYNNYKIFKGVFFHTRLQQPLYAEYPVEYFDTNHYGPFFSVLIAPFALMPDIIGMVLWSVANTWLLYKAVQMLPLSAKQKTMILWIGFIELTTAHHSLQTNPAIAAWIIMTYVFVVANKNRWAPLVVLLGFFVKIYGIVALVFGVFSKNKVQLLIYLVLWAAVLFILPMLFSSPSFVIDSYKDWMVSLTNKNMQNAEMQNAGNMQNISVMGMTSRIFGVPDLNLWLVLVPAALLMLAPLLRFKFYNYVTFQLHYLAAVLLSIVLFSTGSESPTFIIAVIGAAIFFVVEKRPFHWWTLFLLWLMLLLTCFSPTDIFPPFIRKEFIQPYALKALPCFLIWLTIIWKLLINKTDYFESNQ